MVDSPAYESIIILSRNEMILATRKEGLSKTFGSRIADGFVLGEEGGVEVVVL